MKSFIIYNRIYVKGFSKPLEGRMGNDFTFAFRSKRYYTFLGKMNQSDLSPFVLGRFMRTRPVDVDGKTGGFSLVAQKFQSGSWHVSAFESRLPVLFGAEGFRLMVKTVQLIMAIGAGVIFAVALNAQEAPSNPAASGVEALESSESAALGVLGAQEPNRFAPYLRRPDAGDSSVSGDDCSLSELLASAPTPQARRRTMEKYWRLTEKLALYNLAAIHANDVESCIGRHQAGTVAQNTAALWVSARRLASEAKDQARIEWIAEQYRFIDAQRSGGSVKLPVPVDPPTVAPYQTKAEEIAKNRNFSIQAQRLNAVIPRQYEALTARFRQVDETLAAYGALFKQSGGSDETLLAALERHTNAKREMIHAVIAYNQSIADYAAETVGANIKGDRLLMTMNQIPKNAPLPDSGPRPDTQIRMADTRPLPAAKNTAGQAPAAQIPAKPAAPAAPRSAPKSAAPKSAAPNRPAVENPPAASPASPQMPQNVPALPAESTFERPFGVDDFPSLDMPMALPEFPAAEPNRSTPPAQEEDPIIIRGQAPDPITGSPDTGLGLTLPTDPAVSPEPTPAAQPEPPAAPAPTQPEPAAEPIPTQPEAPAAPAPTQPTPPPAAPTTPNSAANPAAPLAQNSPPPAADLSNIPSNLPPTAGAIAQTPPAESVPESIPALDKSGTATLSEEQVRQALQKAQAVSKVLFAVDPATSRAGASDIVELPLSLTEALSSVGDTARRLETVESYWRLRGEIAILLIEEKTLETAKTMYESLENAGGASPEYDALKATWRAYVAAGEALVAESHARIRAEQVTLMTRSGRSPQVGWPLPGSLPCLGPYRLETGASSARNSVLLVESVLIPEKIDALWRAADLLGAPESLFTPEVSGVGTIDDAYLYLHTLDNKRLAAIGFVRAVESLNNSIARYVGAFSDTPLPSETFVRCLIGEE